MSDAPLLVDEAVSRAKFDWEVGQFHALADDLAQKGCWLAKAEFPEAFVVFGTPKMRPAAIAFGALFEFTNYDLWPLSVRLVDPFTRVPYTAKELPTPLLRRTRERAVQPEQGQQLIPVQSLMQAYGPDDVPFLCLSGVREYHNNPGHSGDAWLLKRGTGEGTLFNLVNHLCHYGTEFVTQYQVQCVVHGFRQAEVPG